MSRNATFEEVQQPPATREIANVANITHPYVQSVDASTAYVTNVGGGANAVRIRLQLKDGFGNLFRGAARVSVGPNSGAVTLNNSTLNLGVAQSGAVGYSTTYFPNTGTGLIDVTQAFAGAGAKNVVVEYGVYRITTSVPVD